MRKSESQVTKLIRERRIELGMSQSELARQLGYSTPQLISNIERGVCEIPKKKILAAAKILRLPQKRMREAAIQDAVDKTLRALK